MKNEYKKTKKMGTQNKQQHNIFKTNGETTKKNK